MIELTEDQKQDMLSKKLSYSSLKAFIKSPQHFVHYKVEKSTPTPAMLLGSILDCSILTPDKYEGKYKVMPEFPAKTKTQPLTIAVQKINWMQTHKGVTPITLAQEYSVKKMKESLLDNETTAPYFEQKGKIQHEIFWSDKDTKLEFRGFIDKLHDDYIFDLKKVADGSSQAFMRDAIKYNYPLQAAMYQLGMKRLFGEKPFIYICVESTAPYAVSVFRASKEYLEYGYNEYKKACGRFKFCKDNDLWDQSYEFNSALGYHNLDLPAWIKNSL